MATTIKFKACSKCGGSGAYHSNDRVCNPCNGSGKVPANKAARLTVEIAASRKALAARVEGGQQLAAAVAAEEAKAAAGDKGAAARLAFTTTGTNRATLARMRAEYAAARDAVAALEAELAAL